jgi:hypothetical protein
MRFARGAVPQARRAVFDLHALIKILQQNLKINFLELQRISEPVMFR